MTGFIRRHPVGVYYALACAIFWSLTALVNVSLAFGLLALFVSTNEHPPASS